MFRVLYTFCSSSYLHCLRSKTTNKHTRPRTDYLSYPYPPSQRYIFANTMSIYYGAESGSDSDSDHDTVVLLERFSRPSQWSKTPTTQTFHPFPRLPAELRARVWAIALHSQIEYVDRDEVHFTDEIRIHQEDEVIAQSLRGYPSLFFVNREARYEAAKIDGGKWYSLKAGLEIYANLARENVIVFSCYRGPRHLNYRYNGRFEKRGCAGHCKCCRPW